MKNSPISEANIDFSKNKINYIYDEWYDMTPLGSYKNGGKVRLETQLTEYSAEPFIGPRNPSKPYPISENKMMFNIKIIKGKDIQIMDKNSSDPYCKLEFVGYPDSIKKTRVIEKSLNPFWDEFYQMEIKSLTDIFQITLYDYDKLSKDDIISKYTINLNEINYGQTYEKDLNMIPNNSSITKPGIISVIYQVTEPGQSIFVSNIFQINILQCYIYSFENIIEGNEYFCEVKTVDAFKGQFSNITTDNLLMEAFDLKLRNQEESLEIILYQNEKIGKYKFSKEIKRIRYNINLNDMGEKYIDGVKFTLVLNGQNISFPKHPPFINPKRYIHIYIDRCIDLPIMDKNGLSDPFIKISLNKDSKKRYSNVTRVVFKELNPVFKHTFHIPVYSLRDDKIIVKCLDYDKARKSDKIGTLELNVNNLGFGIIKDDWYHFNKGKVHLITHISEENEPSFIYKEFIPYYLNVKIFEIKENTNPDKKSVSVHMKNDLFPKLNYISSVSKSKTPQFSNAIFSIPITNTNDSYIIELNQVMNSKHQVYKKD